MDDPGLDPRLDPQSAGDSRAEFEFRLGEETPLPTGDSAALSEARRFRDVLGRFCTGVTVVTSIDDGGPVGMTCQSFTSVSLSPPLVLFCPARSSRAWPAMARAGFFCVNLLARGQEELSDTMATRGADKFTGVTWSPSSTGAPIIEGVLGWVDCTVRTVHEAGDHYVVIGEVRDLGLPGTGAGADAAPLLFYRGQYTPHPR